MVDESMLTGESELIQECAGAHMYCGTLCREGDVTLSCAAVSGQTVLAQIIAIVSAAQSEKAPVARLADKIATVFVPVVIVIAVVFGFGMIAAGKKAKPVIDICNAMSDVCIAIMRGIILVAPFGVFGLICPVIASNGIDVLRPLLWLIVVAYVAMIVQILLVYSGIIKIFARMNPLKFLKGEMPVMGFAFASASSVGTLPINMECTEKMGVSKEVTSFVLPLGATINMDGTAIYQGVCAIFIAQVFGIDLSIGQQLTIVMTAVLASIGTAGVPGSGMIMLAMVLQSVGLPVEGVALVAGVDRILDMMRTTVNVTGDAAVATCVDAMQKRAAARRARKAEKLAKAA